MAKIELKEPTGPHGCVLNTGTMEVELREVFLGVGFVTEEGESLSVSMRDGGFEVKYAGRLFSFNNGHIKDLG